MKLSLLALVSSLLLGIACTPAHAPDEPIDLDAAKSALLDTDRAWADAYQSADDKAAAFGTYLTDNIRFLPPDAPRNDGKDATMAVIAQLASMPGFEIAWTPEIAEVSSGADLGYTIGSYHMELDGPDGAPTAVDGKYLTVWQKQRDGSWKVVADTFNSNGPSMASEEES